MADAIVAVLILPLFWTAIVGFAKPTSMPATEGFERARLGCMIGATGVGLAALCLAYGLPISVRTAASTLAPFVMHETTATTRVFVSVPSPAGWLRYWGEAVLLVYAAGLFAATMRLVAAQRRIARLTAEAAPMVDRAHRTKTAPSGRDDIRVTDRAITPLVGPRNTIVIPKILLDRLTTAQIALIVAHERAHIHRRDPRYFALLSWVDALFWFNPFLRRQTRRCRLAAELAVDAIVTRSAPERRKAYAATLIEALRHTSRIAAAPAIFVSRQNGEYRMRVLQILHPRPAPNHRASYAFIAALALPLAVAQWSYAESAAGASVEFSVTPLEGEVTSPFGQAPSTKNGRRRNHRGIDIKAPLRTPIVTPAAGRVTEIRRSTASTGYGNLLTIDHGNGVQTRYAHLDTFAVKEGQVVRAGMVIGTVGVTGHTTGPHLHFELIKNGKFIDPAKLVPFTSPAD